jgi:hypothetical protein
MQSSPASGLLGPHVLVSTYLRTMGRNLRYLTGYLKSSHVLQSVHNLDNTHFADKFTYIIDFILIHHRMKPNFTREITLRVNNA